MIGDAEIFGRVVRFLTKTGNGPPRVLSGDSELFYLDRDSFLEILRWAEAADQATVDAYEETSPDVFDELRKAVADLVEPQLCRLQRWLEKKEETR